MRKVYEWLDVRGVGLITGRRLQADTQAKLDQKLALLRRAEVDASGRVALPPDLLAGPGVYRQKWIYKLKLHGRLALRLMLALGPIDREHEWTLLFDAVERDNELKPPGRQAAAEAERRRQQVIADPNGRRRLLWEDEDDTNQKAH